jgi:phosphatidylinositol 4-kinase
MIEQLASLLLPIDALLGHDLFDPRTATSLPTEVITLFRNMWFLCILFHFTSVEERSGSAMEWQRPALQRIAVKTPAIVLEEARDSLFGEIEYNTVVRQEFAQAVRCSVHDMISND